MYLLFITFGMSCAYFILFFIFSLFFKNAFTPLPRRSIFSIACIVLFSLLTYMVTFSVPDLELSNRILHTFGGGFLAFMVCFLVAKDGKLPIGKFQFFLFSFMMVITLGVVNETMELFLQYNFGLPFARNVSDTWFDLLSNTVGALLASVCFVPFVKKSM